MKMTNKLRNISTLVHQMLFIQIHTHIYVPAIREHRNPADLQVTSRVSG